MEFKLQLASRTLKRELLKKRGTQHDVPGFDQMSRRTFGNDAARLN